MGLLQDRFLAVVWTARDHSIRLIADVLDWFRAQGKGYQTRINAVLRAFVDARRRAEAEQNADG